MHKPETVKTGSLQERTWGPEPYGQVGYLVKFNDLKDEEFFVYKGKIFIKPVSKWVPMHNDSKYGKFCINLLTGERTFFLKLSKVTIFNPAPVISACAMPYLTM